MSDVMLLGILRMPFDTQCDIHLIQLRQTCLAAADRIEEDEKKIACLEQERDDAVALLKSGRLMFNDSNPLGKTLIDFMNCWLDEKEAENKRLRYVISEIEKIVGEKK